MCSLNFPCLQGDQLKPKPKASGIPHVLELQKDKDILSTVEGIVPWMKSYMCVLAML